MTMLAFAASTLIITQIVATAIIIAMTALALTVATLVITQIVATTIIIAMTALPLTVTALVITQIVATTIIVAMTALPLTAAPLAAVIVTTIHLHRCTVLTVVMANNMISSGYARHCATTDALMHGPVRHPAVPPAHAPAAGRSAAAGLAVVTREQS
jgi:hypothetical protein